MMRAAFHWAVIATLVVLGFWGIGIFGQLFHAHMAMFMFLWFFMPVIAIWLNSQPVLGALSVSELKIARASLAGIAIAISFASFAHYDRIRDSLGYRFIDGYVVTYYEETDDYGRPFRAANVSTEHWYSRFGLWVFEWVFLGTCVVLPFVTWHAASRAIDKAIRQRSDNDGAA